MSLISVILPSRGRPDSLRAAVASLLAGEDPGIEVIVGLDEDDPTRVIAEGLVANIPGARVSVNPRQKSVGELFNKLYSESSGDWFIPFPDDYTMSVPDWGARLRDAVKMMPCSLGVAYLADSLYPGFSTFPVVSRRTIELNGFFMPDFFPFLFGDTWWNEVGNLCGVKQPIDAHVVLNMPHGNDHKLRDMELWARLFEVTRAMRVETAIKVVDEIYRDYGAESAWLVSTMPARADLCKRAQAHMFEREFLDKWDGTDSRPPSDRYLRLRCQAEAVISAMSPLGEISAQ
jgi:glycosyltransferase involved in cell wall biosynthesis